LTREAEEEVRQAWNRWQSEGTRLTDLEQQSKVSDDLLLSYREQFNVGRRSLLDVLDSQNTRFNVQVRTETSRLAQLFSEYQILAATDNLLAALGVTPPTGSKTYARERFHVPDTEPAELLRRRNPR
jgi:outer membrane protein, adhesin transport system